MAGKARKGGGPRVVSAEFVASIDQPSGFDASVPEVAFGGRSNVGKSSLLNMLCQRKGLARTSKTPGRTQRVNLFDVRLADHSHVRLADLPGWGHAKVPRHVRQAFGPMIERYLVGRDNLAGLFLLVDARRDPDPGLGDFADWLAEREVAVTLVITKVDKIGRNRRFGALQRIARGCGVPGRAIATSASESLGAADIWRRIAQLTAETAPGDRGAGA